MLDRGCDAASDARLRRRLPHRRATSARSRRIAGLAAERARAAAGRGGRGGGGRAAGGASPPAWRRSAPRPGDDGRRGRRLPRRRVRARLRRTPSTRARPRRSPPARGSGVEVVVVNPAYVLGVPVDPHPAGRDLDPRDRELPARPAARGGRRGTNIVDVEDVAAGHLLAAESGKPGERYILGGVNLRWVEVIDRIAAAVGGRTGRSWSCRVEAGTFARVQADAAACRRRSRPRAFAADGAELALLVAQGASGAALQERGRSRRRSRGRSTGTTS